MLDAFIYAWKWNALDVIKQERSQMGGWLLTLANN